MPRRPRRAVGGATAPRGHGTAHGGDRAARDGASFCRMLTTITFGKGLARVLA
jgi:hypothetical protein